MNGSFIKMSVVLWSHLDRVDESLGGVLPRIACDFQKIVICVFYGAIDARKEVPEHIGFDHTSILGFTAFNHLFFELERRDIHTQASERDSFSGFTFLSLDPCVEPKHASISGNHLMFASLILIMFESHL